MVSIGGSELAVVGVDATRAKQKGASKLTKNSALDGLAEGQFPEKLAGLEGEWLVAILAQTRSSDIGKRKLALDRWVLGVGEDEGVTAQHGFYLSEEAGHG